MRTIYKYSLIPPTTTLIVSPDAEVLTVRVTAGQPVLYLLLDPEDGGERTRRTFASVPTGGEVPVGIMHEDYCGTFEIAGLIFHVFETTRIDKA
jgi:hypothetical protein